MKNLAFLFLSCLLISCGGTSVIYDYDQDADWEIYSTYNYYAAEDSGMNELDNSRLENELDEQLRGLGWRKSNNPQVLINYYAERYETPQNDRVGVGIGSGGGGIGIGIGTSIPIGGPTTYEAITLDFVDAKQDGLLWQVRGETKLKSQYSPTQREAYFRKVIAKMLEKLP